MHRIGIRRVVIGGISAVCVFSGYKQYKVRFPCLQAAEQVLSQVPEAGARCDPEPSGLELINVQVFFRHGARTPIRFFEDIDEPIYDKKFHGMILPHTDIPYEVSDLDTGGPRPRSRMDEIQLSRVFKGGMPAGQLTTVGRDHVYMLGKRLRKRYIEDLGFISSTFDPKEIYVRSTNVQRCIESLTCTVAGMFGAQQFKENGGLKIPVKHMFHEDLYPNLRFCETLRQIDALNPDMLMKEPHYSSAVAKIQSKIGNPTDRYCDIMTVRDHMIARKTHGLGVPDWLSDLETEIERAAVISIEYFVCGDPVHRKSILSLACGRLYGMIENNMKSAITDKNSTQKLHLYSCHDTSVFPLLSSLDYPFTIWPPYAADVRYELYKDDKERHWVKILFCSQEYVPPGCSGPLIPFEQFHRLIKSVIITPDQWKAGCSDVNIAREFARMGESAQKGAFIEATEVPPMM